MKKFEHVYVVEGRKGGGGGPYNIVVEEVLSVHVVGA